MIAKNYSDVRNNFKEICDKVVDDSETVIVKRKNDKDVVVISLDEYSNMMEKIYSRYTNEKLDEALERSKDPNTKWMSHEDF